MKRREREARPEDASLIAGLAENTARAHEAAGRLAREKAVLGTELARLTSWIEHDAKDELFQALCRDAALRGMTEAEYERELIEAARAALKQGGYL